MQSGELLYGVCATCHGLDAKAMRLWARQLLPDRMTGIWSRNWYFVAGYRSLHEDDRYGQQMAAMVGALTDESAIRDVVAYINFLEASLSVRSE